MIAPLRQIDPEAPSQHKRLRHAYRVIASALLPKPGRPTDCPSPVSGWRSWLFAGWVVIVTVVYFIMMLA